MVEQSQWMQIVEANPAHSTWFVKRFRDMAAAGQDLDGEARLVDAMVPRRSRILDAGCGSGRVGGGARPAPGTTSSGWTSTRCSSRLRSRTTRVSRLVGDLAELDLAAHGVAADFEVVVAAGNVMPFLAPSTRRDVLQRLRNQVAERGRIVVGFGAGRGYDFGDFLDDARASSLETDLLLAGWSDRSWTTPTSSSRSSARPEPIAPPPPPTA